jgi:hypothetical protein
MDTNRAPGLDEIPIVFYQQYWDVVKFDVMRMFRYFFVETLDVHHLKYGIITLLPKISGANKL